MEWKNENHQIPDLIPFLMKLFKLFSLAENIQNMYLIEACILLCKIGKFLPNFRF